MKKVIKYCLVVALGLAVVGCSKEESSTGSGGVARSIEDGRHKSVQPWEDGRCQATTKKGTQCKRKASPGSVYCWQHGGTTKAERASGGEIRSARERRGSGFLYLVEPVDDGRCQATTKKGTQCKRKARAGGKYCSQHTVILGGTEQETPVAKPFKKAVETDVAAPAATGLCQGKMKNGEPCKRKAKTGSNFCWQHDK